VTAARTIVRITISGRVQGVWFRAWTEQEATARHLDGWVRNRRDGRVEAVLAGPSEAVDDMIRACHQGPPLARVIGVERHETADDPGSGFQSLPSV
jgi:acylphosphatase